MLKLSDVFTPEQARTYLLKTFDKSPLVCSKVCDQTDKQLQVFACLVAGYQLGEVGRNLPVDIEDTCLNGRVGELINDFYLPVQRPRIEIENDNGDVTKRTIYFMTRSDVEALKSDSLAESVCQQVMKLSFANQTRSENLDLLRVINKRGLSTAAMRMLTVGKDISPAVKRQIKDELQSIIDRLDLEDK